MQLRDFLLNHDLIDGEIAACQKGCVIVAPKMPNIGQIFDILAVPADPVGRQIGADISARSTQLWFRVTRIGGLDKEQRFRIALAK